MLIKTEIIFLPRNRLLTCCLQRITLNISDITIGKGRLISASAASSFISNTSCLRCIVRLSGIYENNGIALPAWESILEALTWTLPKKKKKPTQTSFDSDVLYNFYSLLYQWSLGLSKFNCIFYRFCLCLWPSLVKHARIIKYKYYLLSFQMKLNICKSTVRKSALSPSSPTMKTASCPKWRKEDRKWFC